MFPIFYCLTPFLIILLKIVKLSKLEEDPFLVECQASMASTGELMFESTPQIMLQVYILMFNFYQPTWRQTLAIITSTMTLSLLNIETYLVNQNQNKFNVTNILKFFPLFFLASTFRVIIAFMSIMLQGLGILSLCIGIVIFLYFVSIFLNKKYDLQVDSETREETEDSILDWKSQRTEFCVISFLAMTNLANSRRASILRFYSFYFITFFYLLVCTVILIICHYDPTGHKFPSPFVDRDIIWR